MRGTNHNSTLVERITHFELECLEEALWNDTNIKTGLEKAFRER